MLFSAWLVSLLLAGYVAGLLWARHAGGSSIHYAAALHEHDAREVSAQLANLQPFRVSQTGADQSTAMIDASAELVVEPLPDLSVVGIMTGLVDAPDFAILGIGEAGAHIVVLYDEPAPGLKVTAIHAASVEVHWQGSAYELPVAFSSPQLAPVTQPRSTLPPPRVIQRPVGR